MITEWIVVVIMAMSAPNSGTVHSPKFQTKAECNEALPVYLKHVTENFADHHPPVTVMGACIPVKSEAI